MNLHYSLICREQVFNITFVTQSTGNFYIILPRKVYLSDLFHFSDLRVAYIS